MTGILHRLGHASASHPYRTIAAWVLILLGFAVLSISAGGTLNDAATVPGSSSERAGQRLDAGFPDEAGAEAHLVAHWPRGPSEPAAIAEIERSVRELPGVRTAQTVRSQDGRTVMVIARYAQPLADLDAADATERLTAVGDRLSGTGATVAVGGEVPESIQGPNGVAEGTLHDALPPGADLTGPTAAMLDMTSVLGGRLWVVILAVLAATFFLLLVVFRSLALPLKAVISNLSPVVLFAILFGLSMDYEVFMLSAIRERHEAGFGDRDAVVAGMASTARIITSAAAIMIAVAAGFAFDPSVMVKIIGVGMVSAILVDVTLVRMLLVPAAMALLGRANWYLPSWLARVLPRVSIDHDKAGATSETSRVEELARPADRADTAKTRQVGWT